MSNKGDAGMSCKRLISVVVCGAYVMMFLAFSSGCRADKRNDGSSLERTNSVTAELTSEEPENMVDSSIASGEESSSSQSTISQNTNNQNAGSQNEGSKDTAAGEELLAKPVFGDRLAETFTEPEFKLSEYAKEVRPYKIKSDLSNIENLGQFGSFTANQKKLLSQNGFVVTPSDEEQLFYIYERNLYLKLPGFVTVDSVLQVYHIFYDYSLRILESEKLMGLLEQLTDDMLNKSIIIYNDLENSEVKAEALMNIAYFGVAQLALEKGLPENIPAEAKQLAEQEFAKVTAPKGFEKSPIFGCDLDYSQYKPRGHYTRSEAFERYFRAMMWYGQAPFSLYTEKDGSKVLNEKMTARALLITYSIFMNYRGNSDVELWGKIYNPTVFYVGSTDDLNILDYKDLIVKVYGNEMDLNSLMAEDKMAAVFREAEKLPEPQIQAKWTTVDTPSGKQFRFMGQRYIPDSEILQKLVEPYKRPMPSGLDVTGVLGSDRAYDILINDYKPDKMWPEYPARFKELKDKFSAIPESTWRSNMYYGWLWTLKSLLLPFGQGYPSFMTNAAWLDKSLSTALGSWSELRHDTILYGKQSGAEMGGDMPPVVKSYVEPNIELYERLLWLTRYSRENLAQRDILPVDLQDMMEEFERLLDFLINCSIKELKNEELTEDEYTKLLYYGGTLESLTSSLAEKGLRWFEITSETDKNMAVIADVHTVAPDNYLEEAVGSAAQMFVIVPIGGKLYLTRGAVFDYYEFESNKRLTDEEWQKMLKENKQPEQPNWMKSFQGGDKEGIPVPKEPYDGVG